MDPVPVPVVVPPVDDDLLSALFGPAVPVIRRYADHLATSGVERGLLGPREVPRLWQRHILNCVVIQELVPVAAHLVDVGSGAGLPGLVLAIARPDLRVDLVEPLQRRADWLSEVATDLALPGVSVVRGRAETMLDVGADVCTARAVAALPTLATWCLPLLKPGGTLLALKGRTVEEELVAASTLLPRAGADSWRVEQCGIGLLTEPTTVVVVRRSKAARMTAVRPAGARRSGREARPRRHRST